MIPDYAFKIIGMFDLGLTIFGSIGNLLVFLTCVIKLRDQVSFVFIAFLSVTDFLALYEWNLSHFIDEFISSGIMLNTMAKCRLTNFFQFVSLQASAWLLVLLSFDRFLSIYSNTWRRSIFKVKHAVIVSTACIVIITLVNSNVLFLFGFYEYDENGTYIDTMCWPEDGVPEAYWLNVWTQVHVCLYSYAPFILLSIANFLLLFTLYKNSRKSTLSQSKDKMKKMKSITVTILAVTFLFLLMTGIGTIVNLFLANAFGTDIGYLIILLSDVICFSFHGLNILTLIGTNKKFREELFSLLGYKPGERAASTKKKQISTDTKSTHTKLAGTQ